MQHVERLDTAHAESLGALKHIDKADSNQAASVCFDIAGTGLPSSVT